MYKAFVGTHPTDIKSTIQSLPVRAYLYIVQIQIKSSLISQRVKPTMQQFYRFHANAET